MPIVLPLVALDVLVTALLCIALALLIVGIMKHVGNVFRPIPVVGGYIAGAVEAVARSIAHFLGTIENGIDHVIGAAWHLLARYMDTLWNQVEEHAALLAQIARLLGNAIYDHSGLRALVQRLVKAWHGIEHGIRTLNREWHGIEHRVKALERAIGRGIGHDLRVRIQALERWEKGAESAITQTIPQAIDYVDGEVTALGRFIGVRKGITYAEWVAGIIAAAIGLSGISALRCPSFLSSFGNRGCGLWNGLESLLGMLVDLFVITDLCDLIGPLETAFADVAAPAISELTSAIDSMPCVAGNQPPALSVPQLALPPNPGISLSLP